MTRRAVVPVLFLGLLGVALMAGACGGSDVAPGGSVSATDVAGAVPATPAVGPVQPLPATPAAGSVQPLPADPSWHWQLQGSLNTGHDVDVYDIDLFDTTTEQIAQLRADRRFVVCYFSAGSYEEWRSDATAFPEEAVGEPLDGWPGERWLDIRNDRVRAVLAERLDLAVAKGCQAVEPDNVTGAFNDTGFDLTAGDQLDFNRFLADQAHERGLAIALKNDLDQIDELVDWFDFAVNEQCLEFDECEVYQAFLDASKPVLNAEYAAGFVADPESACAPARALGLRTIILDVALDDSLRIACD